MAETIYTIPVNEAFNTDCECPLCELRKRFEHDTIEYFAGPSLMEPDTRILTNEVGFCARHFELLFKSEAKKLGIGLVLDTYMQEQIKNIKRYEGKYKVAKKGLFGAKKNDSDDTKDTGLTSFLKEHQKRCAVCDKLSYTMDRYVDIIFQLYNGDKEFREKLLSCKGFCLPDLQLLLEVAPKKLSSSRAEDFCNAIISLEINNLERIEKEVDWFTKKFDYRNKDADWGNSKDALPRGISKMTGNIDL